MAKLVTCCVQEFAQRVLALVVVTVLQAVPAQLAQPVPHAFAGPLTRRHPCATSVA